MDKYSDVNTFIDEFIYQSKVWDKADERSRKKAINQSIRTLQMLLPTVYGEDIPTEHLAEQTVWLMKIDDTFQRAELGANSMSVDGFSISIKDKDRSLSPFILSVNGITPDAVTGGLSKRRVVPYSTQSHAKRYIR